MRLIRIGFELESHTHTFSPDLLNIFELDKGCSIELTTQNEPSSVKLIMIIPESGVRFRANGNIDFQSLQEKFDGICVGLSVFTKGRFFWGSAQHGYKIAPPACLETNTPIEIDVPNFFHPIKVESEGSSIEKGVLSLNALKFGLLMPALLSSFQLHSIQYNYAKALKLFYSYAFMSFYEEIFLCFYKALENLCLNAILQKKNFKNDLKDIQGCIKKVGLGENRQNEFKDIYIIRGKIVAHGQSKDLQFVAFEHVYKVKCLLDDLIYEVCFRHLGASPKSRS